MGYRIFGLIKFFEEEAWANAFINGSLYCNTLKYFQSIEEDVDGRGDRLEAASAIIQPEGKIFKLSFGGQEVVVDEKDLAGPMIVHRNTDLKNHVYCMHAVYLDDQTEKYLDVELSEEEMQQRLIDLSEKMRLHDDCYKMGQYAVFVYGPEQFFDAIKSYEEVSRMRFRKGLVRYYDEASFNGEFKEEEVIFKKQKKFSYQKEYRLAFPAVGENAVTINIGSLKDFALKITAEKIRTVSFSVSRHKA